MAGNKRREWLPVLGTALAAGMLILLLYAALGVCPFGDRSVMTGDLGGQYIPYFIHFRRALENGTTMAASFEKSLGGGLLGVFSYYSASPINILYLLFPPSAYAAAAGLILAVKLVLACTFFALFLGRHYRQAVPLWAVIALSLGYGFCGYDIMFGQNIMWHDVVLLVPLLCLGLDRLVREGKPIFYAAVLAIAIFADFYIAYMACIFCVLYFGWLLLCEPPQHKGKAFGLFAVASLAGGFANGWLLLPTLRDINENKAELTSFIFSFSKQFDLPELLPKLFPFDYRFEDMSLGLPVLYCGLLLLPLVFVYFLGGSVPRREKAASLAIIAVFVFSFWIEGLDTIWHGLKPANWFRFRYSFLLCFWLLFLAGGGVARTHLTKRLLARAAIACAAYVAVATVFVKADVPWQAAAAAAIIGGYLLLLLFGNRWHKVFWLIPLLCVAEVGVNSYQILYDLEPYTVSDFSAFMARGEEAVAWMHAQTDAPFRAEKTSVRTLNDPMLLGYWGVSHFGSTLGSTSPGALVRLGYGNYGSCDTYLHGSTPAADALLGIRYLIKTPDGEPVQPQYPLAHTVEDWQVYENPYALPMAITADGAIRGLALENGEDVFLWQQHLYQLLAHDGQTQFYTALACEMPDATRAILTTQAAGCVYARIESGPCQLTVDGREYGMVNDFWNSGVICLGEYGAGETIQMQTDGEMAALCAYTLDGQGLAAASAMASAHGAQGLSMRDGDISLTVEAQAGDVLWLPTCYAAEWRATVDGQPAETFPIAGLFLGVALQPGQNTVHLTWRISQLRTGLAFTALGAALFLWLLWRARRQAQRA